MPTDRAGGESAPLIVDGLSRRFGDREVVSNLDLSLATGERVALLGPNGSGKTTILRCIAGTLTPSSGRVLVEGFPAGSRLARQRVGVSLSQERSFYLRLSGWENLVFFARTRMSKSSAERAVGVLVQELELEAIASRVVAQCSSGMVQQLAFARALLGDPKLVLLDEPTRSLDHGAVDRLWRTLETRPRTSVLIATHRDEDVGRCSRSLQVGM